MPSTEFRSSIHKSIAHESLQAALDANAARRVDGRIAAFASLPDWRERRQQAHAVRAEVIEHLEECVQQFVSKAGQNGVVVHRAQDGAEAIKIILEIVKASPHAGSHGKEILIAKSKTM